MRKLFSVQSLLWVALILALVGSLRHVAHVFTSIDASAEWGWWQAVAIDAGLFALALGITQRRRANRGTRSLWAGILLFSAISVYANLAYGLEYTATVPEWVLRAKPWVLAASLPVLVIYLAEIVGGNISYAIKVAEREAEKERKRQEKAEQLAEQAPAIAPLVAHAMDDKTRALLAFYTANPLASQKAAGDAVGYSRQRVGQRLAELEAQGVIHKNGNGVTVLEK